MISNQFGVTSYIPENCNQNTRFIVYYYGQDGPSNDRKPLENELKTNGSDAIVVYATEGNYGAVNNTIENISNHYNIDDLHVTPVGFSLGSLYSTREMSKIIKAPKEVPPQMLLHIDGFCENIPSVFKENTQALIENDSIVMTIYRQKKNYKYLKDYKALAEAGVNVLFLTYKEDKYIDHAGMNKEFFTKGNLNFLAGTGKLNEMYSVKVYDKETGNLKEIDINSINDLEKIYKYFGIKTDTEFKLEKLTQLNEISLENLAISTDTNILTNPLNNVLSKIKNTSYISNNLLNNPFQSTTQVPSQISNIIKPHYEGTIDLLYKISNDMKEFTKIGPLLEQIDRTLVKKQQEELEQNVVPTNN